MTASAATIASAAHPQRSPNYPAVERWIGISTDEIIQAKLSFEAWQIMRFPPVGMQMSRGDCIAWLTPSDYPLTPKSACIGCQSHDDRPWQPMRDHDPDA